MQENATLEAWIRLGEVEEQCIGGVFTSAKEIKNMVLNVPASSNSDWSEDYHPRFACATGPQVPLTVDLPPRMASPRPTGPPKWGSGLVGSCKSSWLRIEGIPTLQVAQKLQMVYSYTPKD